MSIFGNQKSPEAIEQHTQDLSKIMKEEELIGSFLGYGAHCIEVDDVAAFAQKVKELISPSHAAIDEFLKSQQGRPVLRWDVRKFRKYDAIGSLAALAKYPKTLKPIVIIESITEIPFGPLDIYDDPTIIENLLLHNWKNEHSVFDVPKYGHFEIKPADYSVLITWSTATSDKMKQMWRASDGLAWCGHWPRE